MDYFYSSSLEWKVAGWTNVLNGVVTIPSEYKELLVLSTPNQNVFSVQSSFVPYMNDSNATTFTQWWDNYLTAFVVARDERTVTLTAINNGNVSGAVPYMKVYYR